MNKPALSPPARLQQLRAISLQSGEPFRTEKINWLNDPPAIGQLKAKDILVYYDTLLSMLAWPENHELLVLAKKEMRRFTAAVSQRLLEEPFLQQQLSGTRIPGTELTGCFSYAITSWLVNEYGESVSLHSSEAGPETIRQFFQQLLPAVEYETIVSGELGLLPRIKKIKGKNAGTALAWLLEQLRVAELPRTTKEFLFNELKLYVSWKPGPSAWNNGYLQGPLKKNGYHRQLLRTPDHKKIIEQPLPPPLLLSGTQQQQLVNIARATLVYLFRETDPFTYAAPGAVKVFSLEKGLSIALYSMKPGHRLSLESYIGYLVLKNGLPVAYGGGWIFGSRCQFGINILEPFRGAESALILLQLIRTYHHYYGANRFVVKPYQFGHHNNEALQSGAFWFYYKHGFRPENETLQQLAQQEWEKKQENKGYRSPLGILKNFTGSNLVLLLPGDTVPVFDAATVSRAITGYINTQFHGDRKLALTVCDRQTRKELDIRSLHGWNHQEKANWEQWSLLVQACLPVQDWTSREKKQFVRIIKAKDNTNELDFINRLQHHRRFWQDLSARFT